MIYFTQLGNHGRLGNQFFQYALARSVSIELDLPLKLPNLKNKIWHGQKCLLPELNITYEEMTENPKHIYIEKYPNKFDEGVFKVLPNTDFFGYFQHPSYFIKHKELILKEFSLLNKEKIKQCKDYLSQFNNPTSIHIRLGDYYHLNQCHSNYLNLFKDYVDEAICKFPKNTDFLVFTGGSRVGNNDRLSDFEICKNLFKNYSFIYVENNTELIDLELIKNCKNTIMGWDSTFSWWASFLNENGTVICTDKHQVLSLQKLQNWIVL